MDKTKLLELVLNKLNENLKVLVDSAYTAKEASTNEESKAENKYDTRGLEASYLAAGQAQRAQELKELIYLTEKVSLKNFAPSESIAVTALVQVLINGNVEKNFFILPAGGIEIESEGAKVQTLALQSPLGRSMYNLNEGDEFVMNKNEYEIIKVL